MSGNIKNNIKNNIKKDIIYNAVMDGWKVKRLKKDKIEISKSKNEINEINEINNVNVILNKLMYKNN
jgi:hypothetical protein